MKLKEFDIFYAPRPAIKAQVLADFVVEMSTPLEDPKPSSDLTKTPNTKCWNLHTDGSSNSAGNGAGIVITSPDGARLEYSLKLLFPATNNVAEYEALIAGIKISRSLGVSRLKAHTDSELVANQINGEYEARDDTMASYLNKVKQLTSSMEHFEITHIPRNLNHMADALARLASATEEDSCSGTILREELPQPSIEESEVILIEEPSEDWTSEMRRFLTEGTLPEDRKNAEALKRRAARFVLINSQLYRKSFTTPLLKCLGPEASNRVLQEIHEGICSSHIGPRTLAQKIFRQGYWWPTVMTD
jgi:ribonuclease HI